MPGMGACWGTGACPAPAGPLFGLVIHAGMLTPRPLPTPARAPLDGKATEDFAVKVWVLGITEPDWLIAGEC